MSRRFAVVVALVLTLPAGATARKKAPAPRQPPPKPPIAKKIPVEKVVHGDRRVDDYDWMRKKGDPEVEAYIEAENAYAEALLASTKPLQERLYEEMLGRIVQTDVDVPYRYRGFWYAARTEEGKQYKIYGRRTTPDAPEEILLDLNALAEGQKFMRLAGYEVSDDGHLLAYATDTTGFRENVLRIKDLRTGELYPEELKKVDYFAWAADNRTIFYVTEDAAKRAYRLWRHQLGADPAKDKLVYEEKDERFELEVSRTRSGEYLLASSDSMTASEVRYLRADQPKGKWKVIEKRAKDVEYEVDHRGASFYIRVNDQGRNFRLVTAPVKQPGKKKWRELVAHRDDVMLTSVDVLKSYLVLHERADGLPRMRVVAEGADPAAAAELAMPEPTYALYSYVNADFDSPGYRYRYFSLKTPESIFEVEAATGKSTLLKQVEVKGYDASRYETARIWSTAPDGTKVPVSLLYRKGLRRDGKNPLLLGGYGAYGINGSVGFSSPAFSLIDRGWVYAFAHIRGGGDLGKKWHDQGRMMNKKNTFTDFIAAAEHLIAERYTAADRLAIQGGSAGGLLMGAVTNLRPDLFRVVLSYVPFVDVINTMLDASLPLTVTEYEEWGNPNVREEYDYIKSYCPYTNLEAKPYPTMLVRTSYNDSQVMYWEPLKYVAKLRALRTDQNKLLLLINMAGGHGGHSGRYDKLRELAFDYAFLLTEIGDRPAGI